MISGGGSEGVREKAALDAPRAATHRDLDDFLGDVGAVINAALLPVFKRLEVVESELAKANQSLDEVARKEIEG